MNSVAYSMAPSLKYWPNEKLPSISKNVRWYVSSPTSSMSGVRKHFCTVTVNGPGGCSRPRKKGICGCIPALVRSVERSSARGISDADGCRRCPFDSKKERNPSRISAVARTASIVGSVPRRSSGRPLSRAGARSAGGAPRGNLSLGGDLVADLLERATDEPRHVHLRDADLLRDLGLRQALEEAQVQDLPLALVEHAEAGRQYRAVLRDLVLVLLRPDRLERVELAVLVVPAGAGRARERAVGPAALERLEHLFVGHPGGLRQLRDGR